MRSPPPLPFILLLAACQTPPPITRPAEPAPTVVAASPKALGLAIGLAHGCAIQRDGGVSCWGGDGRDQLGNGRLGYSRTPVRANAGSDVAELAAGARATCARATNGSVSCWGGGRATPLAVPGVHDAVEIEAAAQMTCSRHRDGTVRCWRDTPTEPEGRAPHFSPRRLEGVSDASELFVAGWEVCARRAAGAIVCQPSRDLDDGNGAQPPRVTARHKDPTSQKLIRAWLANAQQTVTARFNTCPTCPWVTHCALLDEGELVCWGDAGGAQVPTGLEKVVAIAAGQSHLCAILPGGSVRCVGRDDAPRARKPDEPIPNVVIAGITDAVEIDAGLSHTCVRHQRGTVSCWGENYSGQLGDGTTTRSASPRAVPGLTDVVELDAGLAHTCARLSDGGVRCWGWGESGQLGVEEPMGRPSASPVSVVGVADAVEVKAGFTHTCARSRDGSVRCWGRPAYGAQCTPQSLGDAPMSCSGFGSTCGSLLDGRTDSHATPWLVRELGAALQLDIRGGWSCGLTRGGKVRCFGAPSACAESGARKTEVIDQAIVPSATAFAVGNGHTCVLTDGGDVLCVGNNQHGQLGDGTTTTHKTPSLVKDLEGVTQLVAGNHHTCARLVDGQVRCWGFNVSGQLGNGTAKSSPLPVAVEGLDDATMLAAGEWHTCAVRNTGAVVCWGENEGGLLGDGSHEDRVTPTRVTAVASKAAAIAASGRRTCILDGDRRVACWGDADAQPAIMLP